jgi:hypothetical protein
MKYVEYYLSNMQAINYALDISFARPQAGISLSFSMGFAINISHA